MRAFGVAAGWLFVAGAVACGNTPAAPAPCVPGRTVTCACVTGGQGIQTCHADGSGFDSCQFCGVARDGFTDVTSELGLPSGAGSCLGFEDFDGDGKVDMLLSVGNVPTQAQIFAGLGGGKFATVAAAKLDQDGFQDKCAIADADNDGRPDILQAIGGSGPDGSAVKYWHNLGGFKFEQPMGAIDKPYMSDQLVVGMGVWDYDQDGWIDLFVGRLFTVSGAAGPGACQFTSDRDFRCLLPMKANNPAPRVFHNDHGKFSEAANVLTGPFPPTTNAMAIADFDGNGRIDLFMSNDFYVDHLHMQTAPGKFVHAEHEKNIEEYNHGMGAAIGDFDGNGRWDVYGVDLGPNNLWLGQGDGSFRNRALELGVSKPTHFCSNWAPLAEDFDLDGRTDIFAASAAVVDNDPDMVTMATSSGTLSDHVGQNDFLFWNEGGSFSSQKLAHRGTQVANVIYATSAVADPDGDGDLDILVAAGMPLQLRYLRNDQRPGTWLVVDPEGTTSNRDGIGAQIELLQQGQVIAMRTVGSQGSLGQSWRRAHFGLGGAQSVDQVRVRWPSGKVQTIGPVKANQVLAVKEP